MNKLMWTILSIFLLTGCYSRLPKKFSLEIDTKYQSSKKKFEEFKKNHPPIGYEDTDQKNYQEDKKKEPTEVSDGKTSLELWQERKTRGE